MSLLANDVSASHTTILTCQTLSVWCVHENFSCWLRETWEGWYVVLPRLLVQLVSLSCPLHEKVMRQQLLPPPYYTTPRGKLPNHQIGQSVDCNFRLGLLCCARDCFWGCWVNFFRLFNLVSGFSPHKARYFPTLANIFLLSLPSPFLSLSPFLFPFASLWLQLKV